MAEMNSEEQSHRQFSFLYCASVHEVVNALNINAIIESWPLVCSYHVSIVRVILNLVSNYRTYHDGDDILPIHWEHAFNDPVHGSKWLALLHEENPSLHDRYNQPMPILFRIDMWTLLWPYMLPKQQESMRTQLDLALRQPSIDTTQWHALRLTLETVGPLTITPFDLVAAAVKIPWTSPHVHAILALYWQAKRLTLEPFDAFFREQLRQTVRETIVFEPDAKQRKATVTWFVQHPFPGSECITTDLYSTL